MATKNLTVLKEIADKISELAESEGVSKSKFCANKLIEAVKNGRRPIAPTAGGARTAVRFYVNDSDAVWLDNQANKASPANPEGWLARMLSACVSPEVPQATEAPETGRNPSAISDKQVEKYFSRLAGKGYTRRKEQEKLFRAIAVAHNRNKILIGEASTGSGKGMALCMSAVYSAEIGNRVVIAAPTIQVMSQLWSEYNHIIDAPPAAFLMGRQEFVSKGRLEQIIDDPDAMDVDAARDWLLSGGLSHEEVSFDAKWLTASLHKVAPKFPYRDVVLTANDTDAGNVAYREQFVAASEAQVIFCTHTMLAMDIQLRGRDFANNEERQAEFMGLLEMALEGKTGRERITIQKQMYAKEKAMSEGVIPGGFNALLVDEAHLLEQNIANAMSDTLSFFTMRSNIRAIAKDIGLKPESFDKVFAKIVAKGGAGLNILLNGGGEHESVIYTLKDALKAATQIIKKADDNKKKMSPKGLSALSSLRSQRLVLRSGLTSLENYNAYVSLSWSPMRQYPQLNVGVQSVNDALDVLWASAERGALVSATLYLPPPQGVVYSQRKLNISDNRIMAIDPIETPWLTKEVTVHLPKSVENEGRLLLMPPRNIFETEEEMLKEESRWHDEVASQIAHVSSRAKGGSLVLTTSYRTIEELGERLKEELGERLVIHNKDTPFDTILGSYMERYYAGMRPVFLATGRAWTGLDISDKRNGAAKDNAVSDLIIPRIPFRTNRSSTHLARASRYFFNEHNESALTFKQGIGRLKRHDKTPKKNLWVLDARLVSKDPKHKSNTKLHRHLVMHYPAVKQFTPK